MTAVWLLALAFFACPQEPAPEADGGCKYCDHRGVLDCTRHHKDLLPLEQQVLFCSIAARCKDCSGSLLVDCKRCDDGPESLERLRRIGRVEGFLKDPSPAEELLERALPRVVTEHLEVIVDVDRLKDGSKKYDGHHMTHLAAAEAEKAAQLLDGHFQAKPHHYARRARIWYWGKQADHILVNAEILKVNSTSSHSLYGQEPVGSAWTGEKGLDDKAMLVASNAVHKGVHLMLSNLHRTEWLGNKKAGWFEVGAAHWYEDHLFLRISTYCIDEANADKDYAGGRWRVAIRKHLAKESAAILPPLMAKVSGTLWEEEHALSWSLYDYLVAEHPKALKPMLMDFKDRKEARDLFREHLGMGIPQVEQAWRDWVAANYPSKDPKPRKKL